MNSKSKHGKNGGKGFSASSKDKSSAPKSNKRLFNDDYDDEDDWGQDDDEFDADADLFNEAPKVKKQSGKRRTTGEDDFNFEDDLNGLGFLDDAYYDDEDDLY